eukprot:gene9977-11693_t
MFAIRVLIALCVSFMAAFAAESAADITLETGSAPILKDQIVWESHGLNATAGGWTAYKQCDSRWGSEQLGTCSSTICSAGCAMSSVAMILATKGAGKNPSSLNSWLKGHGGYSSGCLINWSSVDALGYTKYQGKQKPTEQQMCDGIKAGHGLVANVHNGGHWVLLTGCKGNGVFTVNDPGYSTTTYKKSDIVDLAVYH